MKHEEILNIKKQFRIAIVFGSIGVLTLVLKLALGLEFSSLDRIILGVASTITLISLVAYLLLTSVQKKRD